MKRSKALNGLATFMYERGQFSEALEYYADALAYQECVPDA